METASSNQVVQVALLQMQCGPSKQVNVERALESIAQAASRGVDVLCLPELFAGTYPCQSEDHACFDEAEPLDGATAQALQASAQEQGIVLIGSLFERRAPGLFHNSAVVYDADGTRRGVYRKMHIPDDPLYYEKFYFTPGDLGFTAPRTSLGKLGVCVCWDQWFPEAARLTALAGAQIIFYPTAIGWHPSEKAEYGAAQHDAWETMMRSHAIANGVFVAAVNRVGVEGDLEFWGAAFVADPAGRILARASHEHPELLIVPCDLALIEATRTHWPFLRDRRVDAYGGLLSRWLDDGVAET